MQHSARPSHHLYISFIETFKSIKQQPDAYNPDDIQLYFLIDN